eukprot:734380-Pelagomonas_calceolata.AAC.2
MSGGQMGPWAKCSGMSSERVCWGAGQKMASVAPPAHPSPLTLGMRFKQTFNQGIYVWVAGQCNRRCRAMLTSRGLVATEKMTSIALAQC